MCGWSARAAATPLLLLFLTCAAVLAAEPALPALTGRVVDQAGALSPAQEAALDERLAAHEQATSNQVVVATLSSLQGRDLERFANELYRAWELGQKGRDNGVLLLVAPAERQVRIEVGYGLEGVLTDAISSDIIRNRIVPRFKAGDLPGGINAGVEGILAAIDGAYQPLPRKPQEAPAANWLVLPVAFGLFFLWNAFQPRRRRRRGPWGYGPYYGGWGGGRWGGGSSGGGFSGGGFSGGGGSSGGGGASGSW